MDTADRAPSELGDLPVSIDNIDAAIVQMLAERFQCAARGRDREDEILAPDLARVRATAPDAFQTLMMPPGYGSFVARNRE